MTYNLTNLYNQTNPVMLISSINTLSDGYFGTFLILTIFLIIWVMYSYMRKDDLMIIDGFICSIISLILWQLTMINFSTMVLPMCILFAGILIKQVGGE